MCSMPRATKQTAAACYAERHAECQDLLKRISSRLEQHQKHDHPNVVYKVLRQL